MLKCKELSRLPKAASAKYVNFRRQTPGCAAELHKPGPTYRPDYLDPSHPATTFPKARFPNIRNDVLGLRAFPFAVLGKPDQVWTSPLNLPIETWAQRVQRLSKVTEEGKEPLDIAPIHLNNGKPNAIPMSIMNATSKKRTSNKRHIRGKIGSKLKIAINLIVTRGADVVEINGKPRLVMNDNEAIEMSDKWISPGWTYIFFPTLDIYRMPYYDMIPILRKSLRHVYDQSQQLERTWAVSSTAKPKKVTPLKHSPSQRIPVQVHPTQSPPFDKGRSSQQYRGAYKQTMLRHYSTNAYVGSTTDIPLNEKPSIQRTKEESRNGSKELISEAPDGAETAANSVESKAKRITTSGDTTAKASLRRLPEKRVTEHTFADADSENNQPVIRLGGVVFKGKPATPSIRPMLKVVVNADEPARTEMMKLERNVATEWLGRSETLLPMKHRRRHIMRRVARKEAQRREPLGPEFLGFNSHPNPSYDPFTDVDSRSEASRPRKALIELLKKHSSRSASRTATPSDSDHPFEPGSSVEVTRMGPSDSAPHGFDPFAPLIKTEEATTQLSSSETSTDSAEQGYLESSQEAVDPSDELDNSFDFDYFAAAEPVPEPHHIRPAVLNSDAECIDHKLQSFDPFHPDQPDHSLDPFAPLSSNLNLEHIPRRPSLSTNSAHKPATRSSAAFRAGSSERLKNLDVGLYEKKPIMISWRALRKRRPGP